MDVGRIVFLCLLQPSSVPCPSRKSFTQGMVDGNGDERDAGWVQQFGAYLAKCKAGVHEMFQHIHQ